MALDTNKVAKSDDHLLDLLGKLTRGSENEGLAGLDIVIDLLEHGDGEGGSFAGAGLSLSDHIGSWAKDVRQVNLTPSADV